MTAPELIARIDAAIALHDKPWRTARLLKLRAGLIYATGRGDWIERQFHHEFDEAIEAAIASAEYEPEAEIVRPAHFTLGEAA